MQTITVNSQYDVSNNLIDYDLLFKELELHYSEVLSSKITNNCISTKFFDNILSQKFVL